MAGKVIVPTAEQSYIYTQYFCEENIWWLGKRLVDEGEPIEKLAAIFILNPSGAVPILNQSAAKSEGELMYWDYHVVLEQTLDSGAACIWDFDSVLELPCDKKTYLDKSFLPEQLCPKEFAPVFRRVRMESFHHRFSSDRSHMLDEFGNPSVPFPDYASIQGPTDVAIGLKQYLDLHQNPFASELFSLSDYYTL